ncbi:MAG TPA: hypothetical protein VFP63_08080 [Dehalococcoidia bacterium]|nr:hypothetical protein [Dehalococcoidia bacterium]
MPTKFAIALVAIAALFITLRGGGQGTPGEAAGPVKQGIERFDSVLQQGLSEDTHDKISDGLSGPVSDEFLDMAGASVARLGD